MVKSSKPRSASHVAASMRSLWESIHPAQVYSVSICTTIDQQGGNVELVVRGCSVQGCPAIVVLRFDVSTTIDQQGGNVESVVRDCRPQGCLIPVVLRFDVGTVFDQQGGNVERVSLYIRDSPWNIISQSRKSD